MSLAAAKESLASLVSQEEAVLTAHVNESIVHDFDVLKLYNNKLRSFVHAVDAELVDVRLSQDTQDQRPSAPLSQHQSIGDNYRPRLSDAYELVRTNAHAQQRVKERDEAPTLLQTGHLGLQGVDVSLLEQMLSHDPSSFRPGHEYHALAIERLQQSKNRLRLSQGLVVPALIPKVQMSRLPDKVDQQSPFQRLAAGADPALASQKKATDCLLYTSPSPRDAHESRMPSSA